jgi:hypothetical protein
MDEVSLTPFASKIGKEFIRAVVGRAVGIDPVNIKGAVPCSGMCEGGPRHHAERKRRDARES